jgi:hypothetical protein
LKINSTHIISSQFTWANPEAGCWWHYASPEGIKAFSDPNAEFGKVTVETTGTALAGKPCIRCQPSKAAIGVYAKSFPGGKVLQVDPTKLQSDESIAAGTAGDRHVLGEAVKKPGVAKLV